MQSPARKRTSIYGVEHQGKQVMEELMRGEDMCEALMEIMEPQLFKIRVEERKEGRKEGRIEGRQEGRIEGRQEGRIEGTVETMRDLGHGDAEIKKMIMQKYSLTERETEEYLKDT